MNDLYLIGNGFDLAHGLKTSYNDFLLWYLKECLMQVNQTRYFKDDLIRLDFKYFNHYSSTDSISELLRIAEQNVSITYEHEFFEKIVKNYRDYKWVDIEYEYYMALVKLYKMLESGTYIKESIINQLKELNSCFHAIKEKLVEYLRSVKIGYSLKNNAIEDVLFEKAGILKIGTITTEGVFLKSKEISKDKKLFVCFNYTQATELYFKHSVFESNLIYIHGELAGKSNPIIFGYGDEMDPFYEKIENLNSNEFLKNIKSFNYFKTDNYQRVLRFIEGKDRDFTVKILGHSCGLSDRILLNTIFEHPNCKSIKIYYYEKSPTENDYFEKTQEISRHFKSSMKGEMRKKIVPFEESIPMPQNQKN